MAFAVDTARNHSLEPPGDTILSEIEIAASPAPAGIRILHPLFDPHSNSEDLLAMLCRDRQGHRVPDARMDHRHRAAADYIANPQESAQLEVIAALCDSLYALAGGNEGSLDLPAVLVHAIAVGLAAELIAEACGQPSQALRCLAAGLLHDVGKIALFACAPKAYAKVLAKTDAHGMCICDAEEVLFGIDHTVAGRRVARCWDLPKPIEACIWLHHQPIAGSKQCDAATWLVRIVHLADDLARRKGWGYSGYHHVDQTDAAARQLGISADVLEQIAKETESRLRKYVDLIEAGMTGEPQTATQPTLLTSCPPPYHARPQAIGQPALTRAGQPAEPVALQSFLSRLSCKAEPIDVCATACTHACDAFSAEAAVVFALSPDLQRVDAACCIDGVVTRNRIALDPHCVSQLHDFTGNIESIRNAYSPPPACFDPVVGEFAPYLGDSRITLLPLLCAGGLIGGILLPGAAYGWRGTPGTNHPTAASTSAWLIGAALAAAAATLEVSRCEETIASLRRRLHLAETIAATHDLTSGLATMAAGAAHELNNPLSVIAGRAQILLADAKGGPAAQSLNVIIEQAQRASDIVTDLLRVAKPTAPNPQQVRVRDWADRLRQRWQRHCRLGEGAIDVQIRDPNACIYVDRDQLDQAAGEIIGNAIHAAGAENIRLLINSTSTASDDTIVVSIEDNGHGMRPDVLGRALQPFFSDRPAGRGRGLGLPRASRLVEVNGGRLWMHSIQGKATTVFLSLPARPTKQQHRQPTTR